MFNYSYQLIKKEIKSRRKEILKGYGTLKSGNISLKVTGICFIPCDEVTERQGCGLFGKRFFGINRRYGVLVCGRAYILSAN